MYAGIYERGRTVVEDTALRKFECGKLVRGVNS
jgi:hypothetical protein